MKNTQANWLLACCWLLLASLTVPDRAEGKSLFNPDAGLFSRDAKDDGKPANPSWRQEGDTTKTSPAKVLYLDLWSELTAITPRDLPKGEARPGSRLTYVIRFSNAGTDTMRNLKVINYAPNRVLFFDPGWYTKYVSHTIDIPPQAPTRYTSPGPYLKTIKGEALLDSIAWEFDVIPPSRDTIDIRLNVQVADSIYSSLTLTNFVRFLLAPYDNPPFADQKAIDVAIRLEPKIEFVKSVSLGVRYPGEAGTFKIQYRNVGNRSSDKEVIQDILPPGVIYIPPARYFDGQRFDYHKGMGGGPDTLQWEDPFIPNDRVFRRVEFDFQVSNDPVLQPARYITNVATRSAGGVLLDSAKATLAVLGLPDLSSELLSVDPNRLYSPGVPIPLQGEIENRGGPNSTKPFAVSFYVVNLSQTPPVTIQLAALSVSLPDSSSSLIVTGGYWTPVDSGTYMICMKADADSIVAEFDESNNLSCKTIRIGIGSIKVIVERVSAYDTAGFRGMPAPGFPHPIFSYISVTDQNNYPISGLADSLKFIGPGETTDAGPVLETIWKPLLEYHQENRNLPSSPDIYQAASPPMITEVTADKSEGISVALLLDESGSMSGSYEDARAAVKVFVRTMSPYDHAAVIKFGSQVIIQQALTNDMTAIMNAIDSRFLDGGTALYDAIYQGVAVVTKASGRKAVLVYTDGVDGASRLSLNEAIAYARAEGVPVYTLGFGGANRDILQQIADQTGGLFEYVEDASQGADFYMFLARLWKSYYVLAHATTDPTPDGTWRVVDVGVNYLGFTASDTGLYRAPLANLDLFVDQKSFPELVREGRKYVKAGETVPFTITYGNLGAIGGTQVEITEFLNPLLTPTDFDPPPAENANGRLVWRLGDLSSQQTGAIQFKATGANFPPNETTLLDSVEIRSSNARFETRFANNVAVDTLYTIAAQPEYDLRLTFLEDSLGTIGPNAAEIYRLEVENDSTFRVDNVVVELEAGGNLQPGSYKISDMNDSFTQVAPRRWQRESLLPGQKDTLSFIVEYGGLEASDWGKRVTFVAHVDTLPNGQRDLDPLNNVDRWERTTDFAFDVELDPFNDNNKQTSFDVDQEYSLIVRNHSPVPIRNLTLHVRLEPRDALTARDQIEIIGVSGLATSWVIPLLEADSSYTQSFKASILSDANAVRGIYGFRMHAWVDTTAGESDSTNNRRQWQTTVDYNPAFDLRLTYSGASQDTIKPGDCETYELVVTNFSNILVDSATLRLDIDDGITGGDSYSITQISGRNIPPPGAPIFWRIGPLLPSASVTHSLTLCYDKIDVSHCGQSVNFTARVDTVYRGLTDSTAQDNTAQWSRLEKFKVDVALEEPTPSNDRVTRFDKRETYRFIVTNNSEALVKSCWLSVRLQKFGNTERNKIKLYLNGNLIASDTITWPNISLQPDESFIASLEAEIGEHEKAGTYGFFMYADLQSFSCEDDTANNARTWQTRVFHNPKYDASLDFTGSPTGVVRPNQQQTYTLTVQSFSTFPVDSLLLKVRIDDDKPGNCYSISPLGNGGSNLGDTLLQWRLGELDSGAVTTRTFTVRYDKVEASDWGRTVRFCAEVDTVYRGERDSNPMDNIVCWNRTLNFSLDLVLDPTPTNNHPNANFNDPEPYRAIVRNASDVTLRNFKLCVKLDPQPGTPRERIQILPNPPGDLDTCWTISALAPNSTATRMLDIAILAQDCPDSGTYGFTTTAWVDTIPNESNLTNNRRQWQTTARLDYDVQLTYGGPPTASVKPDTVEKYDLVVQNRSSIGLESLSLLLIIDDAIADSNCYTIQDGDGGDTLTSGQVRWEITSLPPLGSAKKTLTLHFNKITASDLGRRVQFTAQFDTLPCGRLDQNLANNIRRWERIINFDLDLALDSTPTNNHPNAVLNVPEPYRFVVRNASGVPLSDLKLCVQLTPLPETTAERIQIVPNSPGDLDTCWTIAALAPNDTATLTLEIVILAQDCPDSGTYGFTMTAWVDTIANERDSTNNRREWQTRAIVQYDLQLAFLGDLTGSVRPGQVQTYELVVINPSAMPLDNVSLLLTIDDGLDSSNCYTITAVSDSGDTSTSGQLRWLIASVPPHDSVRVTLTLDYNRITASDWGRRVQFLAQLDTLLCGRLDEDLADNIKRWERIVDFNLDLALEPIPDNNRPNAIFNVPEPYRFVVRNASGVPLSDLKLCVQLSPLPGTTDERIQIPPNLTGDLDTCFAITALDTSATFERELAIAILAQDCPDSGTYGFTMTAWVDTIANESDSTNNRREWQIAGRFDYEVELEFTGEPTKSIRPGEVEPYELIVRNHSAIRLDSLSLLLTIDDSLETRDCYTITEVSDGGEISTSGQVRWLIASLLPHDSVRVMLSLDYNQIEAFDCGRRVQFTAQLDTMLCGRPDQHPANNRQRWERTIACNLDLVLEPAPENNQPNAPPNVPVPYRFTVRNASDLLLHDLKLCVRLDTLPGTPRERIKIEPTPPGDSLTICWPIASLAPNETATQEINVTILAHDCPDSGAYGFTMTGRVTTFANESDTTNNRQVWQTQALLKYDVQLAFSEAMSASISPGDTESYHLVVRNHSTVRLDNVSLLLTINDQIATSDCYTITEFSDGGDTSVSGQVRWVIPTLAPDEEVTRTLTLFYNKLAASDWGGRVIFMAQLDTLLCRQRDQNLADNKAAWERIKVFKLDLVLAPTPSNNRPQARFEKPETYQFTARNASDVPLAGMALHVKLIPYPETLPERIRIAGVDGLSTSWPLLALAPNDSVPQSLEAIIIAHEGAGKYGFTMEAWVDSVAGESDTANNRRIWETTIAITDADLIEAFYLDRNLFRPGLDNAVELYVRVRENTEVGFSIYNVAGELVRTFASRRGAIGNRISEFWDGRNDRGDFVGSGLYFIFAELGYKHERPSRRLVVVR